MADAGVEPDYTPVEEVADRVVGRDPRRPVLDPAAERAHRRQITARAASMLARANPAYIRELGG